MNLLQWLRGRPETPGDVLTAQQQDNKEWLLLESHKQLEETRERLERVAEKLSQITRKGTR